VRDGNQAGGAFTGFHGLKLETRRVES